MDNKDWEIESWLPLQFQDDPVIDQNLYLISNYGRIKSFRKEREHGFMLKLSLLREYYSIGSKRNTGKTCSNYVHKLVAQSFTKQPSEEHHNNFVKG